ncbi:GIY-YIG nuclease family protein [Acinetobacter proteolyticus]|nr:GIY-YIG nuclease family protein [Acinetobacter proteolyticus]WEI20106.1 GIY-YIG nuclease family protein [Acinetobacter proteolyticus]
MVEYKGKREKVSIICPIHGAFQQRADIHLRGMVCPKCSTKAKLTKEDFVRKSQEHHGDRYDYTETVYIKSTLKVKIKCHKHGYFEQRASAHLLGQWCPNCFLSPLSKTSYQKLCSEKYKGNSNLYLVRCYSENESFLKVGICATTVEQRFATISKLPYKFELIKKIEDRATKIWDMEKKIHKWLSKYRYTPKIGFAGMGECYSDTELVKLKFDEWLTRLNA